MPNARLLRAAEAARDNRAATFDVKLWIYLGGWAGNGVFGVDGIGDDAAEDRARTLESLAFEGKAVRPVACASCSAWNFHDCWEKRPKGYVRPEFRKPPKESP